MSVIPIVIGALGAAAKRQGKVCKNSKLKVGGINEGRMLKY